MDGTMVAVMVICSVVLAAGGLGSLTWGKLNDRVIPHIISFICFVGCAILLSIFIDDMIKTNQYWQIKFHEQYYDTFGLVVMIILDIVTVAAALFVIIRTPIIAVSNYENKKLTKTIQERENILTPLYIERDELKQQLQLINESREILIKVINSSSMETDIGNIIATIRKKSDDVQIRQCIDDLVTPNL